MVHVYCCGCVNDQYLSPYWTTAKWLIQLLSSPYGPLYLPLGANVTIWWWTLIKHNSSSHPLLLTISTLNISPSFLMLKSKALLFVKTLGAVFDSHMKMGNHVTHLSCSLNFQIRNLNRVRRFLDFNSCHNAVLSLILSKLDYCGVLLNGISHKDITRLQRIQNRYAGLIFKNPNALIPLLFLRSSTGCQWPNVFNSAPLFIPSSLWTTSHLTSSPASSMCASHLLTPSDPPLSLVFMFQRHSLLLAIEHFHPLLLVYGTTSLPWSEALPPLPFSKKSLKRHLFHN